MKNYSK